MPILPRLYSLYRSHNLLPLVGLSPSSFGSFPLATYTWLLQDGKNFTQGLGISVQELYFLECLFGSFRPTRVFAIGNSFGWSTLALSLLNPQAKVVAIDAGYDINSVQGIDLTNTIAHENGLNCKVVRKVSPPDVRSVIEAEFDGPLDFVLIDGTHTNDGLLADFVATHPFADGRCLFALHDVRDCNLFGAFETAKETFGLDGQVLEGTSSGIGVLYNPGTLDVEVSDTLRVFAPLTEELEEVRRAASRYRDWYLALHSHTSSS